MVAALDRAWSKTMTDEIDVFDEKGAETETETDAVEEKVEEETEVEAKVETEEEAETESPSEDKETVGLKAALAAERARRQEAERKLIEVPDPIDDPDAYEAHVRTQYLNEKIEDTREDMLENTEDYLEKEAVFMSLVTDEEGKVKNPALHSDFLNARNPARFAYNYAKKHLKTEELAGIDLEEERRKAMEAGRLAAIEEMKRRGEISETFVPDLTGATAQGSNTEKANSLEENPVDLFAD